MPNSSYISSAIKVIQEEQSSSRKRVLCVEDDRDTCDILRFVMTGYEFTAVHTLAAAEDLISETPYDIYVLDNWLPDGDGTTICKQIRQRGDNAPIVFTSAIGQRRDIDQAIAAGADRYLVKPYEPESLLQTVKELLKND